MCLKLPGIRGFDIKPCLCGSTEENTLRQVWGCLDNWGGMPTSWNEHPERACRPYDRDREGPTLAQVQAAGLLPTWDETRAFVEELGRRSR